MRPPSSDPCLETLQFRHARAECFNLHLQVQLVVLDTFPQLSPKGVVQNSTTFLCAVLLVPPVSAHRDLPSHQEDEILETLEVCGRIGNCRFVANDAVVRTEDSCDDRRVHDMAHRSVEGVPNQIERAHVVEGKLHFADLDGNIC